MSVYTFDGSTGWLQILPTGQVYVNGPWSTGYTSLAGLSFPVASTKWAYFKLSAPWKSDAVNFRTDVLDIEVDMAAGATGGVTITNRLGLAASTPFGKARSFTSLAAIAYPQNS